MSLGSLEKGGFKVILILSENRRDNPSILEIEINHVPFHLLGALLQNYSSLKFTIPGLVLPSESPVPEIG